MPLTSWRTLRAASPAPLPGDIGFAALPRNDARKIARAALREAFLAGGLSPWRGR